MSRYGFTRHFYPSASALNASMYDFQPKPVIFPLHTAEIIET